MFEIDKQRFGKFVAELRKEKGVTQKELAKELFISDKAISKWETGVSIPDTALSLIHILSRERISCDSEQTVDRGIFTENEGRSSYFRNNHQKV